MIWIKPGTCDVCRQAQVAGPGELIRARPGSAAWGRCEEQWRRQGAGVGVWQCVLCKGEAVGDGAMGFCKTLQSEKGLMRVKKAVVRIEDV